MEVHMGSHAWPPCPLHLCHTLFLIHAAKPHTPLSSLGAEGREVVKQLVPDVLESDFVVRSVSN